jgi:hypothetical protein
MADVTAKTWDTKHIAGVIGMAAGAAIAAPILVPAAGVAAAGVLGAVGLGAVATGVAGVASALGFSTIAPGLYAVGGGLLGHKWFKPAS